MLLILVLLISLSLAVNSSEAMKLWELEMARQLNIDSLTRDSQPSNLIFVQNIFKRWKSHRLMFSDISFNEDEFLNDIYLAFRPKEGSNRNQWSYEILSMILSYHQNNHLGVLQSDYRPSAISSRFETLESFIEDYLKIIYKHNIALLLRYDFFLCKLKPSVHNDLVDFMKINIGDKVEQLRTWIMLAQTSEEAFCAHVNIQFREGGCLTYIAQRANDHDFKSLQIVFDLMLSAAVINGVAENLDVLYHQNHKPGSDTVLNGRTFNIKNILPSQPVNLVSLPEFPLIQAFSLPEDVVQYYTHQAERLLQTEFCNGADLGGSPSLKQVQQIIDRWHPRTSVSYINVASREAFLKIFKLMMQTKNTIALKAINEEKWFQALSLCLSSNDDRIIRKFFGNTNITVARAEHKALTQFISAKLQHYFILMR
ncbi:hypothetical protein MP638_001714 [Amoeboaphelidium occidentale]|nr:hypothetical protein MP638_001714 [Amoeboaphelidium occidentale]